MILFNIKYNTEKWLCFYFTSSFNTHRVQAIMFCLLMKLDLNQNTTHLLLVLMCRSHQSARDDDDEN